MRYNNIGKPPTIRIFQENQSKAQWKAINITIAQRQIDTPIKDIAVANATIKSIYFFKFFIPNSYLRLQRTAKNRALQLPGPGLGNHNST